MAISRMIPVALLLAACGCGRALHTSPIVPARELTADERNFQAVWDSATEVLIKYRFEIDQVDRRGGAITTHRQGGRHFFEWWRRDKATAVGALENTVQPLYRTANVRIVKKSGSEYHPIVRIEVSRLVSPPGQIKHPYPADLDDTGRRLEEKKRQYQTIAVGISEDSPDDPADDSVKRSPNDDMLAKRIADEIRLGAYQQGVR